MSSNNIYTQLIELANKGNVTLSESGTERDTEIQVCPEFAEKMREIKGRIGAISSNNQRVLGIRNKLTSSALPSAEAQLYERIRVLCDQNYDQIQQLRHNLENLTDTVKKSVEQYPDEPETHSQIFQKQFVVHEVESIIGETQKIQKLIEKFAINTNLQRIKALAPELTQGEAEEIARKKDGFDQLIMSKTLGKSSLKLKYRVDDIIEKNKSILMLENTIAENLRLMQEISLLVMQQGEMIDSIADNVLNAKDYVQKAEVILRQQKKQHKKSRKKICCIILIGVVILALIITPIVLTIVNQNKRKNLKTN